jgi:hypothetical protein
LSIDIGVDGRQGDREREVKQAGIAASGAICVGFGGGGGVDATVRSADGAEGGSAGTGEEQRLERAAVVVLAPAG